MWSARLIVLLALVAGGSALPSSPEDQVNFCQGCRSLVSFAQVFNSSENRSDYKDVVRTFCEQYYPASADYQHGPCPLFVEGFYYILQNTDPIHHCDQIGACGTTSSDDAIVQPSDDIYEYMKSSANPPRRSDNVVCEFCEQLVTQTKEALSDPATIDQFRRQVDSFCEFLKVIDQDKECRQYLDKYLDQALDFIRDINPKDYCRSVKLCSAGASLGARPSEASKVADLPTLADFQNFGIETSVSIGERPTASNNLASQATSYSMGASCTLCKTVVKELFHFLDNNKTEENIVQALEKVCGILYRPGPNYDKCDSMVKAYTKEIVQLLIDETDPELVCMLLELCHSKNEKDTKQALTTSVASPTAGTFGLGDLISALDNSIKVKSIEACVECKIFIKYLKEELAKKSTQEELDKYLEEEICSQLPDMQLAKKCTKMVAETMPVLYKAIAGSLSSHRACSLLGVCPAQTSVSIFRLDSQGLSSGVAALPMLPWPERQSKVKAQNIRKLANRPHELKSPFCDQCIETVTQIDDYISKHPVDQDVSTLIDKVCMQLPEGLAREKCIYVIKVFGDEIVQLVSTMDNPRQLCSKFLLC